MSLNDTLGRAASTAGPVGDIFKGLFGYQSDAEKARRANLIKQQQTAQKIQDMIAQSGSANTADLANLRGQLFGGGDPQTDAENNAIQRYLSSLPPNVAAAQKQYSHAQLLSKAGGVTQADLDAATKNAAGQPQGGLYGVWGLNNSQLEGTLNQSVNNLKDQLNAIQRPDLAPYVGDVTVDPKYQQAENYALDKLKGLTGIQETAEEKLMREMARQKMEGQMKGERDAMAQSLKERGVYGSGAELASQLSGQQTLANTRALEELNAQANAQKRAMTALGQYSDLSKGLSDQSINLGQINKNLRSDYDKTKLAADQQWNSFLGNKAATISGAETGAATTIAGQKNALTGSEIGTLSDLTKTGINNRNTQTQNQVGALQNAQGVNNQNVAEQLANDKSDSGFLPFT